MSVATSVREASTDMHSDNESMTARQLLARIEKQLRASQVLTDANEGTEFAYEAREILSTLLDVTPGEVSRRSGEVLPESVIDRTSHIVDRRMLGEPLAYCLGSAAFRHLVLKVDQRVLIPRPETEIVVEEALTVMRGHPGGIAVDIGTGSGAIALSLATEGRFDRVIATDISPDAIVVAESNAAAISSPVPVEFRIGADLAPLAGTKACLIVSNPPYIADNEAAALPASVRDWEPSLALFAPDGGMARYDALLAGAPSCLEPGGWLVLEVDSRRGEVTAERAARDGRYVDIRLIRDLAGRNRVLVARSVGDSRST